MSERTPSSGRGPVARRTFIKGVGAAALGAGAARLGWPSRATGEELPPPLHREAASPPDGLRQGARRVIWSVDTTQPFVALTFDDGPDPELTPRVLDLLDTYGVRSTFFVMGYNADRHPDLLRETVARGHEIGSHTWGHADLFEETLEETQRQIVRGREVVTDITGRSPRFFRPPRGHLSGAALRYSAGQGDDIVLWSLSRGVPGEGTPRGVTDHVLGGLHPGDVVLLHDGVGREVYRKDVGGPRPLRRRREVELDALPRILEGILERGIRPVTVSELLQVR